MDIYGNHLNMNPFKKGAYIMAINSDLMKQIIAENDISTVNDLHEFFRETFKEMLQQLLEAELDATLGYKKNHKEDKQVLNKRNGYSSKKLKTQFGEITVDVPRDRNSEFNPVIVPKFQRNISDLDEKIIALYARGLSTRDISSELYDLYKIELSAEMISNITDKILPEIKAWRTRPLEKFYPFLFMDAIHFKVKEEGCIIKKAVYITLGITLEGKKDILSITIGHNESAKFWLSILNDLKNRGVEDLLFVCVDGLNGFKEAINAVYPNAIVQRCIIHMLRNSFKYVARKDYDKIASSFRKVYTAATEESARDALNSISVEWGKKYPYAISIWEANWEDICPYFQFNEDVRKIMYTTNSVESLNRQYRKVTKTKGVFTNDKSLEKMIYLSSMNIMKKWLYRMPKWDNVLNQLLLMYDDRIKQYL